LLAQERIERKAIHEAYARRACIGKNILGSGWNLNLYLST
jgi:NADH:ubiquinone oxidoreductase subunit F (NADH-binding)